MKKELIRQAFFMARKSNEELRALAKAGKITEKQEDLAVVFQSMRLGDATCVAEHYRRMKGTRHAVEIFFDTTDKTKIPDIIKVSAAVYICKHPGNNWWKK